MAHRKTAQKTVIRNLAVAWVVFLLAGCAPLQNLFGTPTARVFASVTPRPTLAAPPTQAAPLFTPAHSPEAATPAAYGGWTGSGALITVENAAELQLVMDAGAGRALRAAVSADGTLLAVASTNGVYLYDPASMTQIMTHRTGQQQTSLVFAPDGSLLASGDWHGLVSVWDDSGILRWQADTGRVPVLAAAFSPDGRRLAAGGWDGSIRIWLAASGNLERTLTVRNRPAANLSFSNDGRLLYAWAAGENIQAWNAISGASQDDLFLGKDAFGTGPTLLTFDPAGEQAAVFYGRGIKVFTTRNGFTRTALADVTGDVRGLAFSGDGNTLAVQVNNAAGAALVQVYDLETSTLIQEFIPPLQGRNGLAALSPDGNMLYTVGTAPQAWHVRQQNSAASAASGARQEFSAGAVVASRSDETGLIWMAGLNGSVRVFNPAEGTFDLPGGDALPLAGYGAAAILPGSVSAFAGTDGTVTVLDLQNETTQTVQSDTHTVNSLAFSPDGSYLAIAGENGRVRVQSLRGNEDPHLLDAGVPVFKMAFVSSGMEAHRKILLQSGAGLQLWSIDGGEPEAQWALQSMAVSDEGEWLAAAAPNGAAGVVQILHLPDGDVTQTIALEGYRLALSPDGTLLAQAGQDLTLWDAQNGVLLLRLENAPCCGQLAFSPDGAALTQANPDGTVQVWAIP